MATFRYLRCAGEVASAPGLAVGDLLWRVGFDVEPGGYEVAVLRRRGDGRLFRVREPMVAERFEVAEVEEREIATDTHRTA